MKPIYLLNDGTNIYEFKTWKECEKHVTDNVRFKKCSSYEEIEEFKKTSNNYFKNLKPSKIYIVIHDNNPYIFNTWNECKGFVEGKKNIVYKSFLSTEDAQMFIARNIKPNIQIGIPDTLYAFVDGSYNSSNDLYGYGICMRKNNETIYEDYGGGANNYNGYRQVTGELHATIKAIKEAILMGEKRVIIVYDYMGVEMWANGSWQTKTELTREYSLQFKKLSKRINIDFLHVNSHKTTDRISELHDYNDRADVLAKKGAFIK